MSDAAERDVKKRTMLKDETVLKNKSNSSGSSLDVKNSIGLPDLNKPLEPVAVSRDITYPHSGRRKNSNGLPDLNESLEPVAVSRDITYPHNGKRKNSNGLADFNEPLEPVAVSRDITYPHNGKRKNSNGLPDMNEPLEPVAVSRDVTYPHNGRRKNTDFEGQRLEKSKTQNSQMVHEAGNDRITQRDPVTDHRKVKVSEEIAYGKLKVGSKKPQVSSYDGYLGSSSVASNAPRLSNDFFNPWSLVDSSWENPVSNPFMNIDTHAKGGGSSFEMESHVSNGLYQGFSPGSNQSVLSQSFQNLQGPRKQEGSAGSPWPNLQPPRTSNIFMDGWYDLTSASAQKGLWSASHSNNANMGRVDMINSQIKPDGNIPFDPSVSSVNQHGPKAFSVDKEKQKEAAKFRHQRKLKMKIRRRVFESFKPLPSFENKGESLQEKPNDKTQGLKQNISSSNGQRLVDDAVSSSTDAATKDPLSSFADIINSRLET